MPRYEVSAWIGKVTTEVVAPNEDDAIAIATEAWPERDLWTNASYEVREVSD